MVKTKIILKPKKKIRDLYFGEDTRFYKYNKMKIGTPELIALGSLIASYHPERVIRIPEVSFPNHIKTPDFLIDGIEYEIKAPYKIERIEDRTKSALMQIRDPKGFVVYDYMNLLNATLCDALEYTFGLCKQLGVENFILMNHGDIIYSTR
jgi:hypothetical protein